MAKLVFTLHGAVLDQHLLDRERMTIGRRPGNDIVIDNLAVSGQHASILTIGQDSFLEDLGSTNGTLVNGVPIKKHLLQHNDVIGFGSCQLVYVNERLAKEAYLQVLSGANVGKHMPLTKAKTTLGKPGLQVAMISKQPQGYFIKHVEGEAPTVNQHALGKEAALLGDHDVIELAGVKMEFCLAPA